MSVTTTPPGATEVPVTTTKESPAGAGIITRAAGVSCDSGIVVSLTGVAVGPSSRDSAEPTVSGGRVDGAVGVPAIKQLGISSAQYSPRRTTVAKHVSPSRARYLAARGIPHRASRVYSEVGGRSESGTVVVDAAAAECGPLAFRSQ